MPPVGMNQQAMIAQQNSNMEALERRRERERARDGSGGAVGVRTFFRGRNALLMHLISAKTWPSTIGR